MTPDARTRLLAVAGPLYTTTERAEEGVDRWLNVIAAAGLELREAATPADSRPEARVDLIATALQETGRVRVHPGDEMAALAALRAIGVETFTVSATPADSLDALRARIEALPYLDVNTEDGGGGRMVALDAVLAALRAEGSSKPTKPRHSGIALWDPVRGARPYSDDDPALSGSSKPEAEKP